jgi:hypothetical protein
MWRLKKIFCTKLDSSLVSTLDFILFYILCNRVGLAYCYTQKHQISSLSSQVRTLPGVNALLTLLSIMTASSEGAYYVEVN